MGYQSNIWASKYYKRVYRLARSFSICCTLQHWDSLSSLQLFQEKINNSTHSYILYISHFQVAQIAGMRSKFVPNINVDPRTQCWATHLVKSLLSWLCAVWWGRGEGRSRPSHHCSARLWEIPWQSQSTALSATSLPCSGTQSRTWWAPVQTQREAISDLASLSS